MCRSFKAPPKFIRPATNWKTSSTLFSFILVVFSYYQELVNKTIQEVLGKRTRENEYVQEET